MNQSRLIKALQMLKIILVVLFLFFLICTCRLEYLFLILFYRKVGNLHLCHIFVRKMSTLGIDKTMDDILMYTPKYDKQFEIVFIKLSLPVKFILQFLLVL